jgi:DNA-binding LacI/PurR family transcriptional regulator
VATEIVSQIAEEVGVSARTVQRVLSGELRDSRPTIVKRAKRIRTLATRLGYRPNAAARAISTGRFGCACLVMTRSEGRSTLPEDLLNALCDSLAEHDMHLTIARLPDEALTSDQAPPKIMREWMADGLLLNYTTSIPQPLLDMIRDFKIPAVWINSKQRANCVHPDDFAAGRTAAERLIRLGHRDIAFADYQHPWADWDTYHYSAHDRSGGYEQAMRKAGLTPRFIREQHWVPTERQLAYTRSWLSRDDRPTAVVAACQVEAVAVAMVAPEVGLRVGRDLSLVVLAPSGSACVHMARADIPHKEIAEQAVEMLARRMEDQRGDLPPVAVPFVWHNGETCAPPKDE